MLIDMRFWHFNIPGRLDGTHKRSWLQSVHGGEAAVFCCRSSIFNLQPERLIASSDYDVRADVWSLGITVGERAESLLSIIF